MSRARPRCGPLGTVGKVGVQMRLPTPRRRNPTADCTHDNSTINVTIHLHFQEIIDKDISSFTDTFTITNDDACRKFLRGIRGGVRLAPEDNTRTLFHDRTPGMEVHHYLRALHNEVPLWPWLFRPSDPWVLLTAGTNIPGTVWWTHPSTGRMGCSFPRTRLYAFLERTRSNLGAAARRAGLANPEWRAVSASLATRLIPYAADGRRLRLR